MHRIDTSTAQKDKFGAGKNGFTLGNAQTGVPPTEVSADILDAMQEEICAVVEGSGLLLDKTNNSQLLLAIKKIASSRYFSAGNPLPSSNIGPIWHDDYADWMTWQTFNQNGANYTGYASSLIGSLLLDTQPTPRSGYIKSGVQNLSRVIYAALRAWAMHNGIMVAPGVWKAGNIACSDNADGTTFRVYDVRGEFLRAYDDSRGADPQRVFGEWQNGTHITGDNGLAPAVHGIGDRSQINGDPGDGSVRSVYWVGAPSVEVDSLSWMRVRPRNTALLAAIKY